MGLSRKQLLASAQQFCDDLSRKKDIPTILSHFSSTHETSAFEHGEPSFAPFFGKSYVGLTGVQKYFEDVGSLVSHENMAFSEFVVDADVHKVAVKGKAQFTWLSTAESWDETFACVFDFDDEGKMTNYQIWGDSGAVHLARIGKLAETRKLSDDES